MGLAYKDSLWIFVEFLVLKLWIRKTLFSSRLNKYFDFCLEARNIFEVGVKWRESGFFW